MSPSPSGGDVEPDIDENRVDRAQIRGMLALTPEERLRRIEEFVESVLQIRELNEARPIGVIAPWDNYSLAEDIQA